MNCPKKYTAKQIKDWDTDALVEGRWIPAKPLHMDDISLPYRLKMAWYVFTGKYDVLDWENN